MVQKEAPVRHIHFQGVDHWVRLNHLVLPEVVKPSPPEERLLPVKLPAEEEAT